MSLLRDRAIEVSFASSFSVRRPAAARAWFVRLTSCDSEAELNSLALQARVERGAARTPREVRAKAIATNVARRRGSPERAVAADFAGTGGASRTIVNGRVSLGIAGWGAGVCVDRR